MKVHCRVLVLVVLVVMAAAAGAQPSSTRILVPVAIFLSQAGANGSVWITELTVRNNSDARVLLRNIDPEWCGGILCGPEASIQPKETLLISPSAVYAGAIIEVPSESVDDVIFNLRVQDLSRQLSTWGTEIPVVREPELLTRSSTFINVPNGAEVRHTLRLYEIEGSADAEFDLMLYSADPRGTGWEPRPDRLLGSKRVRLAPPLSGWEGRAPSYLQIGDLNEIADVGDAKRLVVQVVPVSSGMRYWAFISVTNNETQHVTTILP